ncbi:sulfopyruvate decarboxylase subunit alpha [ANME-1 cluster archaeon GoMg4]|nr:sulfopyruvate decarboxylase subunit alpha [ANME-1 cluster archaeon GoMg4]NMX21498.1 sulfopyruvate decarboxylase subunit alpha [ANME-1 cluster archaeon GoMg4]
MVTTKDFCSMLKKQGFDFFTGVPCSILKGVINYLSEAPDIPYVPATREDEAIGIATGAYLAGKKPAVLMQNSGLGNSISVLGSLVLLYEIPILLLISWRGYQGKDAPEHLIMGKSMLNLLDDIGVPSQILLKEKAEETISDAVKIMDVANKPTAIIVKRGVIE